MTRIVKTLSGTGIAVIAVMNADAEQWITVNEFSAKVYEVANMKEIERQNVWLAASIRAYRDTYKYHLDCVRRKENPSDLLRTDNYKYYLTLYDVIPTEIAKMIFNIEVKDDSVNYITRKTDEVIECNSTGYKDLLFYDQSNWNYLLLVNVLNQIKYNNMEINEKLIDYTSDLIIKQKKYFVYGTHIKAAVADIKQYFDELDMYEYLNKVKVFITNQDVYEQATVLKGWADLYKRELDLHLRELSIKKREAELRKKPMKMDKREEILDEKEAKQMNKGLHKKGQGVQTDDQDNASQDDKLEELSELSDDLKPVYLEYETVGMKMKETLKIESWKQVTYLETHPWSIYTIDGKNNKIEKISKNIISIAGPNDPDKIPEGHIKFENSQMRDCFCLDAKNYLKKIFGLNLTQPKEQAQKENKQLVEMLAKTAKILLRKAEEDEIDVYEKTILDILYRRMNFVIYLNNELTGEPTESIYYIYDKETLICILDNIDRVTRFINIQPTSTRMEEDPDEKLTVILKACVTHCKDRDYTKWGRSNLFECNCGHKHK